jgi:ABC-type branched-subunit amino acid transport system substrate-binding protein
VSRNEQSFFQWTRTTVPAERVMAAAIASLVAAVIALGLLPAGDGTNNERSVLAAGAADRHHGATGPSATETTAEVSSGPPSSGFGGTGAGATTSTGAGASTSQPKAGGAQPRGSSDVGVSPDAVKVGFTIINLAGVDLAGVAADIRTDISDVIDALVGWANHNGGILGRTVVAHKEKVDILSVNDQRAKCLRFTETEKVFGIIDSSALLYEASKSCVTIEHRTPLVNASPSSSQYQAKAAPYDVSPKKDDNRRVRDWVYGARDLGLFDKAKGFRKLGILSDTCSESVLDAGNGLKAYLREIGITSWSEFRLSCDPGAQQRDTVQAVLQHKRDGVDLVMLASGELAVVPYLKAAKAQQFKPRYSVSDYNDNTEDVVSKNDDPDQFDRTVAVTQYRSGETAAGKPLSDRAAVCSKILTDAGLPAITGYDRDLEAVYLCENFLLFLDVARRAGVGLTRVGWAAALSTIGEFRPAFEDVARFDKPGKTTGGDSIATIEWRRECRCWVQVAGFRPAYG